MSMDRINKDALRNAIARNSDEHTQLRPILASIESAQGIDALLPLLKELHQTLMQHFASERFPERLFDVIEETHPAHAKSLRELEEEHSFFMHKARDLIFRARTPETNNAEDLLSGAQVLVQKFRDHEKRERTVVEQVLAAD